MLSWAGDSTHDGPTSTVHSLIWNLAALEHTWWQGRDAHYAGGDSTEETPQLGLRGERDGALRNERGPVLRVVGGGLRFRLGVGGWMWSLGSWRCSWSGWDGLGDGGGGGCGVVGLDGGLFWPLLAGIGALCVGGWRGGVVSVGL